MIILDGTVITQEEMSKLDKNSIQSIKVLKGITAITDYGEKAKDGVVIISTKEKFDDPLYVLDGKIITITELDRLSANSIASINVLKGDAATALYKAKGENGVIIITSR